MTDEELYERLAAVTGYILNQPELLAEWTRDWWPYGASLAVKEANLPAFAVVPDTATEVAAVLHIAAEAEREVILKGGGTNLVGAIESRPGAILLDLRGLNVIEAVNSVDGTVQVDAGVHGGELEERLNDQGYTLGHYPRSLNVSTVGGWVATRAAGAFATKYGGIDDLIVGLEIVLPDGTILSQQYTPQHAVGPRWLNLFAGSEGAFGIVTSVTLRVHPIPEERRLRAFSVSSYFDTLHLLRKLIQRGVTPAAVALYDASESDGLAFDLGIVEVDNLLILAFDGPSALVEAEESLTVQALLDGGGRVLGAEPGTLWFERMYRFDWFVDGNEPDGGIADEIDVTAPWSAIEAVISAGRAALAPHANEIWVHTTAIYPTGAMVGFTFFIQQDRKEKAMLAYQLAWKDCIEAVIAAGGGIAHHNGVGRARLPWFESQQGEGMRILQAVKSGLDPLRRLNRGRLGMS